MQKLFLKFHRKFTHPPPHWYLFSGSDKALNIEAFLLKASPENFQCRKCPMENSKDLTALNH